MSRGALDAIVVIGGGVNGLVCAGLLAQAGAASPSSSSATTSAARPSTREIAPGFRVPTRRTTSGRCARDVVRELELAAHGLEFVARDAWMTALDGRRPLGHALARRREDGRGPSRRSTPPTPTRWPAFMAARAATRARRRPRSCTHTPPSIDTPAPRESVALLRTARRSAPWRDRRLVACSAGGRWPSPTSCTSMSRRRGAARGARRRRHLRRDARPVVGRQRPAVPAARGQRRRAAIRHWCGRGGPGALAAALRQRRRTGRAWCSSSACPSTGS